VGRGEGIARVSLPIETRSRKKERQKREEKKEGRDGKNRSRGKADRFDRIPRCPSIIYSANYAFVICGRIGCASARFALFFFSLLFFSFFSCPARRCAPLFAAFFSVKRAALSSGPEMNDARSMWPRARYTARPFDTRRSHARAKRAVLPPPPPRPPPDKRAGARACPTHADSESRRVVNRLEERPVHRSADPVRLEVAR